MFQKIKHTPEFKTTNKKLYHPADYPINALVSQYLSFTFSMSDNSRNIIFKIMEIWEKELYRRRGQLALLKRNRLQSRNSWEILEISVLHSKGFSNVDSFSFLFMSFKNNVFFLPLLTLSSQGNSFFRCCCSSQYNLYSFY